MLLLISSGTAENSDRYLPEINKCSNKSCGQPLQYLHEHLCQSCGTKQYDAKLCVQCFWPIPVSNSKCIYCFHIQDLAPFWKPCVLCNAKLEIQANSCSYCFTPQDFESLKNATFRLCNNDKCRCSMLIDLKHCWVCKDSQPPNIVELISFDKVKWHRHLLLHLQESHTQQIQQEGSATSPQQAMAQGKVSKMKENSEKSSESDNQSIPQRKSSDLHPQFPVKHEGNKETEPVLKGKLLLADLVSFYSP